MAEKHEIEVTVNDGENIKEPTRRTGKKLTTFARVRNQRRTNGIDPIANLKNVIGDKSYNRVYDRFVNSSGGNMNKDTQLKAQKAAEKSRLKALYLVNQAQQATSLIANTAVNIATIHIDNKANSNLVDNVLNTANQVTGAFGNIVQGGIAGGWVGAVVAVAMEALKVGAKAMEMVAQTEKNNEKAAYQTERRSNRLGYIETGYSR